MASVVSRLRLRAPAGSVVTARARVEDALRLADTDDRLLLLRRVDLGRVPVRAHSVQWAARAAERVNDQRRRAVHAATPGALSADAVWFRSVEEARTLLLRELAAGRVPSAWFWRLAVRDWGGLPLVAWLPRLVADASRDPRRLVALAHAVVAAAAAGHLSMVAAALADAPPPVSPSMPVRIQDAVPSGTQEGEPEETVVTRVHRLMARHDPAARAALLAAIPPGPAPRAASSWIARFALVVAAPELAALPAVLARAASVLIERASQASIATAIDRQPADGVQAALSGRVARHGDPAAEADDPVSPADAVEAPRGLAPASPPSRPTARPIPPPDVPAPQPDSMQAEGSELASAGAGVFLLVRSLVLMGLPEWLDCRPSLAADRFGRCLLHIIAVRMRVAADDPVFGILSAVPDPGWQTDLDAWRVGLDRWLRRTARIRLAEVVRRRGWITAAEDVLTVRFRVDTADIRLRRWALDIDPGWVPWLGLVARYHYRDEPVVA